MKNGLLKIMFPGAVLMVLFLSMTGCTFSPGDEGSEKTLKVGVLGPFSGRAAGVGAEFTGAVELAFEQVDYTIGDYNVEIVWIDSQSDPERATRAYEHAAVNENIDVCILNYHSSVAIAAMDVAARNKLPHFFGIGGTEIINEKFEYDPVYYSYYMGKTWPSPEKLTGAYIEALEYAVDIGAWEPRNNRAAIYGENTEWGKSFGSAMALDFEKAGWEIVGKKYFTTGAINLEPLMGALQDMDASVIAGSIATAPSLAAFIQQTSETGLESVIIADGLGWVGDWHSMTGSSSDYVLDQVPGWNNEKAAQFVSDFDERYGYKPSASSGGLVYDKTAFFIKIANETLAEHGELNRETFYRYGQDYVLTGRTSLKGGIVMDEYKYTPDSVPDPVVGDGYFIFPVVQYYQGDRSVIWPAAWKDADFKSPAY